MRVLVLCVSALMSAFDVVAEETCLSFDEAVEYAAANSVEALGAKAELDAAEASKMSARALWYPKVDAFTRNSVGDNGLSGAQIQNQIGLSLSQRVFDFGDGKLARRAADSEIISAKIAIQSDEDRAAFEAAALFVEYQRISEILEIQRETLAYYDSQEEAVGKLLEVGLATRSDQIEIQVVRNQAAAKIEEAEFNKQKIKVELETLTTLNRTVCRDNSVMTLMQERVPQTADDLAVETLLSFGPIRQLGEQLISARLTARREENARLPVISLQAITAYASESEFKDWRYRDRIGVDVSVPLYSGNELKARQNKSKAAVAQKRAELARLERDIEEEARLLKWREVSLEAQQLELAKATEHLKEQLDVVELEIKNGVSTIPRLVEVREKYERIRLQYENTRFERAATLLHQAYLINRIRG